MKKTENFKNSRNIPQLSINRVVAMILFSACLFAWPILLAAQDKTIHGRVTTERNDPVPGASVVLKGTNKGQVTNGAVAWFNTCAGNIEQTIVIYF